MHYNSILPFPPSDPVANGLSDELIAVIVIGVFVVCCIVACTIIMICGIIWRTSVDGAYNLRKASHNIHDPQEAHNAVCSRSN